MNPMTQIDRSLEDFINNCNHAYGQLQSAHQTEMLDACTENNSIVGFVISWKSSSKNHHAASLVDRLQFQAARINEMVRASGIMGLSCVRPLNTDFCGTEIRNAENAEHSLLPNLFTGWGYSSLASTNTMGQINYTMQRVLSVRDQAQQMRYFLQDYRNSQCAPCKPVANYPNSQCAPYRPVPTCTTQFQTPCYAPSVPCP